MLHFIAKMFQPSSSVRTQAVGNSSGERKKASVFAWGLRPQQQQVELTVSGKCSLSVCSNRQKPNKKTTKSNIPRAFGRNSISNTRSELWQLENSWNRGIFRIAIVCIPAFVPSWSKQGFWRIYFPPCLGEHFHWKRAAEQKKLSPWTLIYPFLECRLCPWMAAIRWYAHAHRKCA